MMMQSWSYGCGTGKTGMACKSVSEIAGGMGLRSPQQLGLDFAPAQVRSHGLRDAHTYPQVALLHG